MFGQEMSAAGYITENDFGKITYIFAHNESETKVFYNGVKDLFEGRDMFFYAFDDPSRTKELF